MCPKILMSRLIGIRKFKNLRVLCAMFIQFIAYRLSIRYTERMDRYCQEAFRLNVKFSLGDLQRAINGDGRNEPNPLFKILLNLDGSFMVFMPTIATLTDVVVTIGGKLIAAFANVPRMSNVLTRRKTTDEPVSC